jgi:hypothetical protein
MLAGTIAGSPVVGRRKKCQQEQAKARRTRRELGARICCLCLRLSQCYNNLSTVQIKLYNDQRNAQVFKFIYLFTSALHVSGFLLAHFQRHFGDGSSLLGMVSAPGR